MTRLQRYPSQPTKTALIQLPMTKKEADVLLALLMEWSITNPVLKQLWERLKTKIAKHDKEATP
jgi:DNA-binding MarR family transcriptional regulator